MAYLDQYRRPVAWLEDCDLKGAARCIVAAWFARLVRAGECAGDGPEHEEFGMLEPYLAEAIVVDRGADFVFSKWGAALGVLCGGNRLGHRLSVFPQPSRGHLRRACVRAATSRAPAMIRATWALDGEIWRCTILALPTDGDDLSAKRLLVALLFAPHPIFMDRTAPKGFGWPPAPHRGSVMEDANPHNPSHRRSVMQVAVQMVRRLLAGDAKC